MVDLAFNAEVRRPTAANLVSDAKALREREISERELCSIEVQTERPLVGAKHVQTEIWEQAEALEPLVSLPETRRAQEDTTHAQTEPHRRSVSGDTRQIQAGTPLQQTLGVYVQPEGAPSSLVLEPRQQVDVKDVQTEDFSPSTLAPVSIERKHVQTQRRPSLESRQQVDVKDVQTEEFAPSTLAVVSIEEKHVQTERRPSLESRQQVDVKDVQTEELAPSTLLAAVSIEEKHSQTERRPSFESRQPEHVAQTLELAPSPLPDAPLIDIGSGRRPCLEAGQPAGQNRAQTDGSPSALADRVPLTAQGGSTGRLASHPPVASASKPHPPRIAPTSFGRRVGPRPGKPRPNSSCRSCCKYWQILCYVNQSKSKHWIHNWSHEGVLRQVAARLKAQSITTLHQNEF